MTDRRLNIAFIWHMHQPVYRDPFTGEYAMPWVLLHGTKDYYDMAAVLEEFPEVHTTFNYVPCLLEQINEYASGSFSDRYRSVSARPAKELSRDEKTFILQNFFQANWDHMIRPLQRYRELLTKRGISNSPEDIRAVLRYFAEEDYLDLQVLFNLVWVDPQVRRTDEFLSSLVRKGRGFTEEEKLKLLDKQVEIMGLIIPKLRDLAGKGVIEVSTSPYFHPILPLLCDSASAREAMPGVKLPRERFVHPEDAREQILRGIRLYEENFGARPRGLWPSEGSVSMDILPIVAEAGIEWLASDEEILSNSIKRPIRRDHSGNCYDTFLYRPYSIEAGGRNLVMLFRDHVLSDLIGFDYAKMPADSAANDLIGRLMHIHNLLENPQNHVVSIILDGENAWEHYRNDGRDFLVSLYSKLSGHPNLRCVTVSEFLSSHPTREDLRWLFPGSWINHNFRVWIGHPEDNTAWEYISDARAELAEYEELVRGTREYESKKAEIDEAWKALYAAEGSDWFWWYGDEHSSMSDDQFDALFRKYIKRVYTLIGKEPPLVLDIPITSEAKGTRPASFPTAYINPVLDGAVTNYFEWLAAGTLERHFFGSAMHRELSGGGVIDRISYGFSEDSLFLRLDYFEGLKGKAPEWSFTITFLHPIEIKLLAKVSGTAVKASVFAKPPGMDKWVEAAPLETIAANTVVELAMPLRLIGAGRGDEIRLFINVDAGEKGVERWPLKGFLILDIPGKDFEAENWIV